jgi:hypothetical protein
MKPQVRANYLCDKYKRDLITRFSVTPSGRRRVTAIYLSFAGRPCTPEKLLWADWTSAFSKRPNWTTIANQISLHCLRVSTKGLTPNGYTHRIN